MRVHGCCVGPATLEVMQISAGGRDLGVGGKGRPTPRPSTVSVRASSQHLGPTPSQYMNIRARMRSHPKTELVGTRSWLQKPSLMSRLSALR
jgi:hypothetical protein